MVEIVVLGSTGLVGSMVYAYLKKDTEFKVYGTSRQKKNSNKSLIPFSVSQFLFKLQGFEDVNPEYIINCIGQKEVKDNNLKNAIEGNSLFPHALATYYRNAKIISLTTDGVFSGKKGSYTESDTHDALDFYARTKSLGEGVYANMLHIRCSPIGPDPFHKKGIFEWFLAQKNSVDGYDNYIWQGVTTLQFAQLIRVIIKRNAFHNIRTENHVMHFAPNSPMSKYELLRTINDVYKKDMIVNKIKNTHIINRSLDSNYSIVHSLFPNNTIRHALCELKEYMHES